MNDVTKNILTGVAVSVAVSSFAVTMLFGEMRKEQISQGEDIATLKAVRHQHKDELARQAVFDEKVFNEIKALNDDYENAKRTVLCILAHDEKDKRLQCIAEESKR